MKLSGLQAFGLRVKDEGGVVKLIFSYRVELQGEVEVLRRSCQAET